jgi:RNA polymerase sigma-70 factor (ECF subfamily)
MEDSQIIRHVQSGDTEAFALLVSRYHRNLLNFIFRLVGDGAIVEDLGQEVFLRVFRSLPGFDPDRGVPFAAWLFTIARNRCASELRCRRERRFVDVDAIAELPADVRSAEEVLLAGERREALRDSLRLLPEPYRTALLRSLDGQSLEEIAIGCAVSVGTVKSRLFRAKERMKALVGEIFGGKNHEAV